eukprot:scaffold12434_cov37-Tisochrysis_lutea.AAC.3
MAVARMARPCSQSACGQACPVPPLFEDAIVADSSTSTCSAPRRRAPASGRGTSPKWQELSEHALCCVSSGTLTSTSPDSRGGSLTPHVPQCRDAAGSSTGCSCSSSRGWSGSSPSLRQAACAARSCAFAWCAVCSRHLWQLGSERAAESRTGQSSLSHAWALSWEALTAITNTGSAPVVATAPPPSADALASTSIIRSKAPSSSLGFDERVGS